MKKPNKNKWQIHKVAGRWVVRMPNYIGHWIFTFSNQETCIIFMNGVELYHRLHPEWTFIYDELHKGAAVAVLIKENRKEKVSG